MPAKPFDVVTTLEDFALVSYAIDPGVLARHLPPGFEPELLELAGGETAAFVSAVPFRDRDFRFEHFPAVRFAFAQTNYRAYVRYRGESCVWFFCTTLGSPLVAVPRFVWKLPWHYARTKIDAAWQDERCQKYELRSTGRWSATLCAGPDLDAEPFSSFADPQRAFNVLTNPMTGHYRRRNGSLGNYRVWHDHLHLRPVAAQQAHFDVFEQLGLVDRGTMPHSVLVTRSTEFSIFLPPRSTTEA